MANKRKRRPSATPPAEKPTQEQAVSNEGATDQQRMIEKEKDAIIQGESEKTDTAPPDPGKILIRIKDKKVTVLPAEDDPAELAEAAEQLKKAQERLQAAFAPAAEIIRRNQQIRQALVTPAIEEMLRHNRQIQQTVSPAFELFLQTQYQRNSAIEEYGKIIAAAMRSPAMEAMQNMVITMQTNLERVTRTFQSMQDIFDASRWDSTRQMLEEIAATAPALLDLMQEVSELTPYLEAELKKPEYEGKTLDDLLSEAETGSDGLPVDDSIVMQAIAAARAARDADAEKKQLPKVAYTNGTDVKTVTDKFANLFFSIAAPQSKGELNGQRQFIPVRYEKRGAKKEITLLYDYSFNEDTIQRFGLSRNFDDQAFFVASVIDNLLDEGNSTISATKLWHEMGNDGSPNADALTNLINILRLGMSTIITADISQIVEAWGIAKDGKSRELISQVIPVQIAHEKFAANGKTASAMINITGHTPFYIIGYPLNHYTTWSKDVLRLYKGRRTKRYYSVLRFLITQIGWMRNEKSRRSNKILYESLYEYTGDKTTRARQLSRDMMYKLFDEVFIPTGYISAYKEDSSGKPGVILTYTPQPKITAKK